MGERRLNTDTFRHPKGWKPLEASSKVDTTLRKTER